jgi:hypothetical protein
MRNSIACLAFACVFSVGSAEMAKAETIKVTCEGKEFNKPYALEMVYDGDDLGTLKVTGSYGDMSLPAAKNVREGTDEDGNKITAINIWGSGDMTLVMPDEAAIEACVRQKLTPEQTADSDIVRRSFLVPHRHQLPPNQFPLRHRSKSASSNPLQRW